MPRSRRRRRSQTFVSIRGCFEIIRGAVGMSRVAELASRVRVFENDAAMIAGGGLIHAMKRNEGLRRR